MTKIVAFYLPQFHTIPENDLWWGEGFTEWTNVKKARPLFRGHYQPRVPLFKNYYNLSDSKVMESQMQMAERHGIHAFCFYHYWFKGKKLLEKPVESILENPNATLPFCLAWANEPWTRTWDGALGEKEVLIAQDYGNQNDWDDHFNYLLRFWKDDRYLRSNNKPVLLIYKAESIPNCEKMLVYWEEKAVQSGLEGLIFLRMRTFLKEDRRKKGFQGTVDFEPNCTLREYSGILNKRKWDNSFRKLPYIGKFFLPIYNYEQVCNLMMNKSGSSSKTQYRGCFVGFDNTARLGIKVGRLFIKNTPENFEKTLESQLIKSKRDNQEFLFLNAWNEWAEGNYLEPDEKYGYAYLNAIQRVTQKVRKKEKQE